MKKEYVSNDQLSFIKNGYPGNLLVDNTFTNTDKKERPIFKELIKWAFSRNPQKEEKKQDTFKVPVNFNEGFLNEQNDSIVWLGHASFYLRINGISILTDPIFFDIPTKPRLTPIPCHPDCFKNINYILLSHCHRDHLDIKTLKILIRNNPAVEFLVPLRAAKFISPLSKTIKIQEAGWFQRFNVTGLSIDFLPARHWNRRGLTDFNKELWGSFMFSSGNRTIYFSGDTSYGDHFKVIAELYPQIDISILPIGAYKPDYMMHHYHVNPQEAFKAFLDLKSEKFIPMHYGTYELSDEPPGEPVRTIQTIFLNNKTRGLMIPDIGTNLLEN